MGNAKSGTIFHFDAERDGDRIIARLSGDLDLANAPRLREALEMVHDVDALESVINLAEVDFIDSSCLGVLVRAAAACRKRGRRFVLQSPSREVVLALAASGLVRSFVYDQATLADSASGRWPSRLPVATSRRRRPQVVRLGA
jgi:anti-sigma B factor antagonist